MVGKIARIISCQHPRGLGTLEACSPCINKRSPIMFRNELGPHEVLRCTHFKLTNSTKKPRTGMCGENCEWCNSSPASKVEQDALRLPQYLRPDSFSLFRRLNCQYLHAPLSSALASAKINGGGADVHTFVACCSHLTVDHASLARRVHCSYS